MNAFATVKIKYALSSPKNLQTLIAETGLPERTLRYNLEILKKGGIIEEMLVLGDMRRKLFFLGD